MLERVLDLVAAFPVLGLWLLGAAACIEYLFPPFPGDTITLFGAFLVTARDWNGPLVFGSVAAGSMVGVLINFILGRWLRRRTDLWVECRKASTGWRAKWFAHLEEALKLFHQRGGWILLLNRFLPGFRAVLFVAAGMSGMRGGKVLIHALVSVLLWNALLFVGGMWVGDNWDRLNALLGRYLSGAWVVMGLVVLVGGAAFWIRRQRRRRHRQHHGLL